jgi:hypothetical protein
VVALTSGTSTTGILTRPILATDPTQLPNTHGLDQRSIDQAAAAITQALASRGQLARAQLAGAALPHFWA